MYNRILVASLGIFLWSSFNAPLFCDDSHYKLYVSGDYENSFNAYKQLLDEDLSNPVNNFFFGKSAIALGKMDDAISAFERVLIVNPSHIGAKIELIKIHILQNNFDIAKAEFYTIDTSNLNEQQKELLTSLQKKLTEKNNSFLVNANIAIGYGYNSNATNGNDITQIINNIPISNEKQSDHFRYENLSLQLKKSSDDFPNIQLFAIAGLYNETYNNLSEYDIRVQSGHIGSSFTSDKIYMKYLYSASNYTLMDKHWLNHYNHEISISSLHQKNLLPTLYAMHYTKKNILTENSDKDSTGNIFGFKMQYFTDNKIFGIDLKQNKEDRQKGDRTDISKKQISLWLYYQWYITNKLSWLCNGLIEHTIYPYKYPDPINIDRKDDVKSIGTQLAYSLPSNFKLNFDISKKWSDSTLFLYKYDQMISKISLEYNF